MRRDAEKSAFSLVEILVVMAVILILAGALIGAGRYLVVRASVDLAESELEVLAAALEQYYDDLGEFPPQVADQAGFNNAVPGNVTFPNPLNIPDGPEGWSSSGLFYFLDRNPNSRKIVEALTDSLISNKGTDGKAIQITIDAATIDLPRFIDPWGTSIGYEYVAGTAFPELTSAGPDMKFDTSDDIVN